MSLQHPIPVDWWLSRDHAHAIRDYAILLGLVKKPSTDAKDYSVTQVSVTLSPFNFPSELFQHAVDVQRDINLLMDAVSQDQEFIARILETVVKTDEFTRRLFEIHTKVLDDNKQTCTLGLHRSDYMIDYKNEEGSKDNMSRLSLKQIEINTISASCFGLSQDKIEKLHRFVKSRYLSQNDFKIPENKCLDTLTDGIAHAWKEYGNPNACVLIVTQPVERNIYDIRPIEYLLWEKYNVQVVYKTLTAVNQEALLGPDRELILSGQEIAVVYYRTAYMPDDYPSDKEWDARLLLERSRATNCPCISYQLVGSKKIQQALSVPGVIEKFVNDPTAVRNIRATFTGLYSLDVGPKGDSMVDAALKNPDRFVAKPQREGGGNNYFGDEVRTLLQRIGSTPDRGAYILMDKIESPMQQGFILNPVTAQIEAHKLIGELGVLGVFLRRKQNVLLNIEGGYILRSKPMGVNEGGLGVGASSLDIPTLVTSQEFIRDSK